MNIRLIPFRTRAGFHKAGRHFSRSRRPFSIGPLRDPYNRANVTFGVLLVTCGSGYFLSADAIEEKRHGRSARLRRTHDLLRNRYGSSPTIIGEVDEEFVNGERSSETRLPQVFSHGFPSPFTSAFVGNNLVLSLRNVDEGRWWTLIAHTFEHGSWTHLFANFTGIWSMRQYVAIYGIRPFAALWIGGGLAGGLTGLWAEGQKPQVKRGHRDGWMMGASASVLALVTTCSFLNPKSRVMIGLPIPMPFGVAMGVFTAGSIVCASTGVLPFIGHEAHLGGIVFGAFWWLFVQRRFKPLL